MYKILFKRWVDFVLSLIGLLIASPVFLLVTVLLAFANKDKPFFFQPRPGKNEKIFRIVKFKTMNDKSDGAGNRHCSSPGNTGHLATGEIIPQVNLKAVGCLLSEIV